MNYIERLVEVINCLGTINAPVGMLEQIGVPIYQARNELIEIVKDMSKNKTAKEEPKIEVSEEVVDIPDDQNTNK